MMKRFTVTCFVVALLGMTQLVNAQWFARGDFNGWDTSKPMLDNGVLPDAVSGDLIFTAGSVIPTLGSYPGFQNWKAADASWGTFFPPQNSRIWMTALTTYTLFLDTKTYTDGWVPNHNFVYFSPITSVANGPYTVVGSFNGGSWDPAAAVNHMTQRGDGKFFLDKVITTAGSYEFKVAFNDAWAIQCGVNGWEDNASTAWFTTTSNNQTVRFMMDPSKGRIKAITDMTVKINETCIDDASTDNEEFIEIYGPGGKSLTGWTLQLVNGANATVYQTYPLTSIPADGFLVVSGQATCPNIDMLVTPATDMIQNGQPDAIRIMNPEGDVVDALGYEVKTPPAITSLVSGLDFEGPGFKADVLGMGFNTTDYSLSRPMDGYDTNNNAVDFCFAPATPGETNQKPRGLLPTYSQDFDTTPGITFGSEFWGYYTDPSAVAPGTAGTPSISSPQGGNFGVFSDQTGGGDAFTFMDRPTTDCYLDTYVYLADTLAPGTDSVFYSVVVRGYQDIAQNLPTGTYNGQTGVIIEFHRLSTYSVLRVVERVSNALTKTICQVSVPGTEYSGWTRVRIDLFGSNVVATLGGTVGNLTDGEKFKGTTNLVVGGIGIAFREYLTANEWLCLDDLNIGIAPNTALPPNAPTNLALSSVAADSIGVSWTDAATGETGYYAFAAQGRLSWTPTASLPADSNSWTTNTLSPNTLYKIKIGVYDANGMARTDAISTYTLALVPGAPVVTNPGVHTLDVAIGADGNPPGTQYAIYLNTTDQWVQADGTLGASEAWATASAWATKTVTGLDPETVYVFRVKARNTATIPTALGAGTGDSTLPATGVKGWKQF